jgi:hypothetical protein
VAIRRNLSRALHGAAVAKQLTVVQFLDGSGRETRGKEKLTPLMVVGKVFMASTSKEWFQTIALLKKLMTERGLKTIC